MKRDHGTAAASAKPASTHDQRIRSTPCQRSAAAVRRHEPGRPTGRRRPRPGDVAAAGQLMMRRPGTSPPRCEQTDSAFISQGAPRSRQPRRAAPSSGRRRHRAKLQPGVVDLDDARHQARRRPSSSGAILTSTVSRVTNGCTWQRCRARSRRFRRRDEVGAHGALDLRRAPARPVDLPDRPGRASRWRGILRLVVAQQPRAGSGARSSQKPRSRGTGRRPSAAAAMAQGATALISSAAGTRIALLTSEPRATAQTTGSSRSRTP